MPDNVSSIKGFRTPPKPTKGQVQQENETLASKLEQRLQNIQQLYGNIINQVMRQSKTHDQELSQISIWLGSAPTNEAAGAGDNLLMDYAGVLLNDDGTDAKVKMTVYDGSEVEVPDYFDGGSGKLFMLTNLTGGTLIAGFEEQLVGLKAGEGKEVNVKFPDNYNVESLKGKNAKFTVYIHEVRKAFTVSPVGVLINENERIKAEARARAAYEAQAKKVEDQSDPTGSPADSSSGSQQEVTDSTQTT